MPEKKPNLKKIAPDTHVVDKTTIGNGIVTMEKGFTKAVGDFNFAKLSVTISLPIDYTEKQLAQAKSTIRVLDKVLTKEIDSQLEDLLDA